MCDPVPKENGTSQQENKVEKVIDPPQQTEDKDPGFQNISSDVEQLVEMLIGKLVADDELKNSGENQQTDTKRELKIDSKKLNSPSTVKMGKHSIVEPLLFSDSVLANDSGVSEEEVSEEDIFRENEIPCILCDFIETNTSEKSQQDYLCHLIVEHNIVIADVKLIADLRKYVMYWKTRFRNNPISDFCVVIKTTTFSKELDANYNMLCDTLPEDRELRENLHIEKLKSLLEKQRQEREDESFHRMCLFCTKIFHGNRINLFSHMNEDHNFNVGHPDNIVDVYKFLNEIEQKLNKIVCLFCEKSFKDRAALRDHMRKKSHRRLNPKNKDYDKYYIINYLELGKTWETIHGEPDSIDYNEDWEGWNEESQNAVCFFCEESFATPENVYSHMEEHGFSFNQIRKEMHLSFYQQVKMINYIRRQIHRMNGKTSDDEGGGGDVGEIKTINSKEKANIIMEQIRSSTKWNQPQYYFPTYENDSLLCQLEDKEGLFEPEDTFVVGEDGIDCKNIINESVLTDLVVGGYFD